MANKFLQIMAEMEDAYTWEKSKMDCKMFKVSDEMCITNHLYFKLEIDFEPTYQTVTLLVNYLKSLGFDFTLMNISTISMGRTVQCWSIEQYEDIEGSNMDVDQQYPDK